MTRLDPILDMDRRILHRKIRKESNKLIEEFVSLHIDVQTYLMEIDCKVPQLLTCIMDVKHVKQVSKESPLVELKTATSVSGVILELISKNLISFLQFTVVKRIIEKFCSASQCLQKQLQQYECNFSEYILRRVCDSNIYNEKGRFEAFTTGDSKARSDSKKMVELLIVTDDKWGDYTPLVDVLDLEEIISESLDIDRFNLHLLSIVPNCLRIHYAISVHIAHSVFPLTTEEWKKLTSHGIFELKCGTFQYIFEEKGKAMIFYVLQGIRSGIYVFIHYKFHDKADFLVERFIHTKHMAECCMKFKSTVSVCKPCKHTVSVACMPCNMRTCVQ